jgi:hypothetical protein
MSLLDKLAKVQPAGRGICLLTATEIKQITQARKQGYSWDQIHKAVEKYNSAQALSQAYWREVEADEKENG